ncbi:MAG: FtsX-like permease family protein [Liquorilactobacillus satsumensis]
MFLAIREMKHDKVRYGLVISLIFLVSYLVFILTGLATGLSDLNKSAIEQWNAAEIVLDKDAQGRLPQSYLRAHDLRQIGKKGAQLAQFSTLVKSHNYKENAQLLAIKRQEFIYKKLPLQEGKKFGAARTVVVSAKFKQDGFKLGDSLTIPNSKVHLKIVGFITASSLNVAPVMYTSFETLKEVTKTRSINGVVFQHSGDKQLKLKDSRRYSIAQFIEQLPGYSAQQLTFNFMIGFLFVIILIVISIFLYILTLQKLPNFGVMKAQGIPTGFFIRNTLVQTLLMSILGVAVALGLAFVTALILPTQVPIKLDWNEIGIAGMGIIVMSLAGALIPIRQIIKVDPIQMIGG